MQQFFQKVFFAPSIMVILTVQVRSCRAFVELRFPFRRGAAAAGDHFL